MWLCHDWGWQPPQTASHIHIRHIQSVWAHWYTVHRHMVAALHSYTHPTWLRFWGSGSLVEAKQCHDVMFEADSNLKLLLASILDIYIVFWYAVHRHMVAALHSYSHLTWLRFWGSGSLVESNVPLGHGWGWQPPQTASHIHIRHIQRVWAHWYAVHRHTVSALHSYTHPTCLRFWGSGSLVESKWCDYVIVEAASHLKLLPTSILDIYKAFQHIDMMSIVGKW